MSSKATVNSLLGDKRLRYRVAPLLLLLFGVVLLNFFVGNPPTNETLELAETAVSSAPASATRPPILQAIILPSPTPAATTRPRPPATAAIEPMGPPQNSSVLQNSLITFYWTYTGVMEPGQEFVITVEQDEMVTVLGTILEPNFGDGFQLAADLSPVDTVAGTAVWRIDLRWKDDNFVLLSSAERTFIFLPN